MSPERKLFSRAVPLVLVIFLVVTLSPGFFAVWYKASTHVHSRTDAGEQNLVEKIGLYKSLGYSIVVSTEHYKIVDCSGFNERGRFLCVNGEEYSNSSHMCLIGIKEDIRPLSRRMAIFDAIAQGGVVVVNHTNDIKMLGELSSFSGKDIPYYKLASYEQGKEYGYAAMEIFNGKPLHFDPQYVKTWQFLLSQGYYVFGVASDDAHTLKHVGKGWIWVNMERLDEESFKNSLRKGYFYASTGVEFSKPFEISCDGKAYHMGESGKCNGTMKLTASAGPESKIGFLKEIRLFSNNGEIDTLGAGACSSVMTECRFEFEINPDFGGERFYRIEAVSLEQGSIDGKKYFKTAYSNPIWISGTGPQLIAGLPEAAVRSALELPKFTPSLLDKFFKGVQEALGGGREWSFLLSFESTREEEKSKRLEELKKGNPLLQEELPVVLTLSREMPKTKTRLVLVYPENVQAGIATKNVLEFFAPDVRLVSKKGGLEEYPLLVKSALGAANGGNAAIAVEKTSAGLGAVSLEAKYLNAQGLGAGMVGKAQFHVLELEAKAFDIEELEKEPIVASLEIEYSLGSGDADVRLPKKIFVLPIVIAASACKTSSFDAALKSYSEIANVSRKLGTCFAEKAFSEMQLYYLEKWEAKKRQQEELAKMLATRDKGLALANPQIVQSSMEAFLYNEKKKTDIALQGLETRLFRDETEMAVFLNGKKWLESFAMEKAAGLLENAKKHLGTSALASYDIAKRLGEEYGAKKNPKAFEKMMEISAQMQPAKGLALKQAEFVEAEAEFAKDFSDFGKRKRLEKAFAELVAASPEGKAFSALAAGEAIKSLDERFGKKQELVDSLKDEIRRLEAVRKELLEDWPFAEGKDKYKSMVFSTKILLYSLVPKTTLKDIFKNAPPEILERFPEKQSVYLFKAAEAPNSADAQSVEQSQRQLFARLGYQIDGIKRLLGIVEKDGSIVGEYFSALESLKAQREKQSKAAPRLYPLKLDAAEKDREAFNAEKRLFVFSNPTVEKELRQYLLLNESPYVKTKRGASALFDLERSLEAARDQLRAYWALSNEALDEADFSKNIKNFSKKPDYQQLLNRAMKDVFDTSFIKTNNNQQYVAQLEGAIAKARSDDLSEITKDSFRLGWQGFASEFLERERKRFAKEELSEADEKRIAESLEKMSLYLPLAFQEFVTSGSAGESDAKRLGKLLHAPTEAKNNDCYDTFWSLNELYSDHCKPDCINRQQCKKDCFAYIVSPEYIFFASRDNSKDGKQIGSRISAKLSRAALSDNSLVGKEPGKLLPFWQLRENILFGETPGFDAKDNVNRLAGISSYFAEMEKESDYSNPEEKPFLAAVDMALIDIFDSKIKGGSLAVDGMENKVGFSEDSAFVSKSQPKLVFALPEVSLAGFKPKTLLIDNKRTNRVELKDFGDCLANCKVLVKGFEKETKGVVINAAGSSDLVFLDTGNAQQAQIVLNLKQAEKSLVGITVWPEKKNIAASVSAGKDWPKRILLTLVEWEIKDSGYSTNMPLEKKASAGEEPELLVSKKNLPKGAIEISASKASGT